MGAVFSYARNATDPERKYSSIQRVRDRPSHFVGYATPCGTEVTEGLLTTRTMRAHSQAMGTKSVDSTIDATAYSNHSGPLDTNTPS